MKSKLKNILFYYIFPYWFFTMMFTIFLPMKYSVIAGLLFTLWEVFLRLRYLDVKYESNIIKIILNLMSVLIIILINKLFSPEYSIWPPFGYLAGKLIFYYSNKQKTYYQK